MNAQPATALNSPDFQNGFPAEAPQEPKKVKSLIDFSKFQTQESEEMSEGVYEQSTYALSKPGKTNFFRTHPEREYRKYGLPVIEDRDERKVFIVDTSEYQVPKDVARFVTPVNLVLCANHKGQNFVWYFKSTPGTWSKSAASVVRAAATSWVRIQADMNGGQYLMEHGPVALQEVEPQWPAKTFDEILNIAFEGAVINSDDNPVIRSLRGLI